MTSNNCRIEILTRILFHLVLLGVVAPQTFASDTALETPQLNAEKAGVFVFTSEAFEASKDEFGDVLIKNGFDTSSVRSYVERDTFGFKEFSDEVSKHSANLKNILIIFNFHGAQAGGCGACSPSSACLQGNLSAKGSALISAQRIVDDFLVPMTGKKIAIFFQSCFSGHFAMKVKQAAEKITWEKPTPIALIATDNNAPTSTFAFPYPEYSRKFTKFRLWDYKEQAAKYEQMVSFRDFVDFVNAGNYGYTFTFFPLNDGASIRATDFGFKDHKLKPLQEMERMEALYTSIREKLRGVTASNLIVLVVERERTYENLRHGDMWINAFKQNGVPNENIHWVKTGKTTAGHESPQIHSFSDSLDFITPENNVLLFIRGDEHDPLSHSQEQPWSMMLDGTQTLSAERIATELLPAVIKANRVLVLLASSYADLGFDELVPMISKRQLENVAVVSFYQPKRDLHRSLLCGWPMNFLSPLYSADFLFYADGKFRDLCFDNAEARGLADRTLNLFRDLVSFEDYLEFLKKAVHFPIPGEMAIKTHNVRNEDLRNFGFLPLKLPPSWDRW